MNRDRFHHVLLVDDNDDDNFFHQRAIKRTGLDLAISVCRDGVEALDFLTEIQRREREQRDPDAPDLIFLDINMPRLNGWEFVEEFAQLDEDIRRAIIVIMLSTSPNPADREKAERSPYVEDFIDKPLTDKLFLDISRKYFNVEPGR